MRHRWLKISEVTQEFFCRTKNKTPGKRVFYRETFLSKKYHCAAVLVSPYSWYWKEEKSIHQSTNQSWRDCIFWQFQNLFSIFKFEITLFQISSKCIKEHVLKQLKSKEKFDAKQNVCQLWDLLNICKHFLFNMTLRDFFFNFQNCPSCTHLCLQSSWLLAPCVNYKTRHGKNNDMAKETYRQKGKE